MLLNRDGCRTPMHWSPAPNAGFTTPDAEPWLPLHPCKDVVNVEAEARDPSSIFQCYRRLLRVRKERPALHSGSITLAAEGALPAEVLGFRRASGDDVVDVLLHFDDAVRTVRLPAEGGEIIFSSYGAPARPRRARSCSGRTRPCSSPSAARIGGPGRHEIVPTFAPCDLEAFPHAR